MDCPVGPYGHSDGDAILHALCDALLGAAGLDDLGTLFPDTDPQWEGVSSAVLLRNVVKRLADAQLTALSVDIAVCCDRPKLSPHRGAIRAQLSEWLGLPVDRVNVKGKTREGCGGEVECIDVTAVVLLSGAH
jgi:2-C-methyl-D-erythritol 2,4-cyclodiphosphate synthase